MCLTDTPNDPLARRPFRTSIILESQGRQCVLNDSLADCGCSGAHTVINEDIVDKVCEELQLEPIPLSVPKPLRGYDGKLSKKPITHCILPTLNVNGHKEGTCPMLIAKLGKHQAILGKPWMNKHGCLLDMMMDKILFVPGRCHHDNDNTSSSEELTFIPPRLPAVLPPPVISKRPPPAKVEEETMDDTTQLLDHKEIDILEVGAAAYYKLARDKDNKLFSLTIAGTDKAYPTPVPSRGPRVPVNKPCPCGSEIKYKRCCGSNTPVINKNGSHTSVNSETNHPVRINSAETLTRNEILAKLPIEYHDFADVFDRTKADELSPHRPYDYKLEFIDNHDKIGLSKSRIYSISGHKLE